MAGAEGPRGEFRLLRARDLHIIRAYQRKPSEERLRKFDPWEDAKVGIILVAQITDGTHKGRLHPYDGATRVLVKQRTEPDYVFPCYVTPMTGQEAAEAFLVFNQESVRPSAFNRYQVGIHAKKSAPLQIKRALDALELDASPGHSSYGGDGKRGEFAAFAAAERIVSTAFARSDSWPMAGAHFAWCLTLTRAAYPDHGSPGTPDAHDADIIQAASYLGLTYPAIVGDSDAEAHVRDAMTTWHGARSALLEEAQAMRPGHWRQLLAGASGNTGGSQSRGYQIGALIATNHNRVHKPQLRR